MRLAPTPLGVARSVAVLLGLLVLAPLVIGAGLHAIPPVAATARSLVPLAMVPSRGTADQALGLFLTNVKAVNIPLAGAALLILLSRSGRPIAFPRALLDVILTLQAASDAALLMVAIAGYGPERLAMWIPHVPLEFGALALSLTLYRRARTSETCLRDLRLPAGGVLAALAAAAALETWATPQT